MSNTFDISQEVVVEAFTKKDAAKKLSVSVSTLENMMDEKTIFFVQRCAGGTIRIPQWAIDAFLQKPIEYRAC